MTTKKPTVTSAKRDSTGGRDQKATGKTPIFEPEQKKAKPRDNATDSKEIAREQGRKGDTAQRDHERERGEAKPASASDRPAESRTSGMKNQGGGVPSGTDEDVPTRPPGKHSDEANIDEAHEPR